VRYNEGHALYLAYLARKEGTKRGFLSKKAAEASRWHEKWFALYQNVLFYFEGEQSGRPAGMYLLEGCSCERTPAPPRAGAGPGGSRDSLDKQVPRVLPSPAASLWPAHPLAVLTEGIGMSKGQGAYQSIGLRDPPVVSVAGHLLAAPSASKDFPISIPPIPPPSDHWNRDPVFFYFKKKILIEVVSFEFLRCSPSTFLDLVQKDFVWRHMLTPVGFGLARPD
jgi:hypothetical protein